MIPFGPDLDRAVAGALRAAWLRLAAIAVATLLVAVACGGHKRAPKAPGPGHSERGLASWYGEKFHGRPTASGERYDMHAMTAAHKKLPLGTVIDVTHLGTGRKVRVRVNDRGPFIRGRIVDLSYGAAQKLGMVAEGVARVRLEVVAAAPARRARPAAAPATHRGPYAVQIGSFRDRDLALDQKLRLEAHYRDVAVREDNGWHRVQVGRLESRKAAEALRRRLLDRHQVEEAVIVALTGST